MMAFIIKLEYFDLKYYLLCYFLHTILFTTPT